MYTKSTRISTMGIKKLLLVGIAALFLAAGTAHAIEESPEPPEWMEIMTKDGHDNRPWVAKCALHRTPSGELIEWGELCCKRYPNVPHCMAIIQELCHCHGVQNCLILPI